VQIAGFLARRIVCRQASATCSIAARPTASSCSLARRPLLPPDVPARVRKGERVVAGETVLGELPATAHAEVHALTPPTLSASSPAAAGGIPPLRGGVYILPNLFTTGCLVAGFYSIICTHEARYRTAAYMILLAQLCDMLDGRIARLTRATSSFGVQYDSLADLIAFGVARASSSTRGRSRRGAAGAGSRPPRTSRARRSARAFQRAGGHRREAALPRPAEPGRGRRRRDDRAALLLHGRQGHAVETPLMPLVIFGVAALMVSEIRYFSFKELNIHRRHRSRCCSA
jgi:CDP-diacylglycerol--serine O-phosphatidyltransferase